LLGKEKEEKQAKRKEYYKEMCETGFEFFTICFVFELENEVNEK
jgi:hypothetical protein